MDFIAIVPDDLTTPTLSFSEVPVQFTVGSNTQNNQPAFLVVFQAVSNAIIIGPAAIIGPMLASVK